MPEAVVHPVPTFPTPIPSYLAELIDAWPSLPQPLRPGLRRWSAQARGSDNL